MRIEEDIKLDFCDVLIKPQRTTLSSRSEVCLERTISFRNSGQTWTGVPIMCSNMSSISSYEVYCLLSEFKMITVFHKFFTLEHYKEMQKMGLDPEYFMISTGISDADLTFLDEVINSINVKFICVDVANGGMERLVDVCAGLHDKYPEKVIVAGNVVSKNICEELVLRGKVDIVKVGIGSGSACITRTQTGCGIPQLSANLECSDAAHGVNAHIISDGGITCPGDAAKAFGSGADFVMVGGFFSGHDENPGEIEELEDGTKYKLFYGMSSETAMKKYYGKMANYRSSEGRTIRIKYKGPMRNTVQDLLGGIRSTCTYINAQFIKNIPKCTTFIKVNRQLNTVYV